MGKAADDEFVRMTVLVLLGTVLAPVSKDYIPKDYYALVRDVNLIGKMNWNNFTLRQCLSSVGKVLEDGEIVERPTGNLAVLQVRNIWDTLKFMYRISIF